MIAYIPVDNQSIVEPAPREEQLNISVLKGRVTCTDVCPQLDIPREVP